MKRVCSVLVLATAVLLTAGLPAGVARADGLPVLGVDVGGTGVASSATDARYVTLPAGRQTVVARVDPRGGRVLASRLLNGSLTIPAVAYDGSASGLSADGRILVLIEPRASFPRARTTLLVLAALRLRPLRLVRLRGDYSFDAISPRGALMYLIEYTTPTDPSRYLVRAYDLHSGRLLAKPVVDPREQTGKMRGSPLTRATSPDGRFAYTLYDGAGATPFIHALDTSRHTARCIDLDLLAGSDYLWRLRLTLNHDGRTLALRNGHEIEAVVDTRTYQVSTPAPEVTAAAGVGRHSFPARQVAFTSIAALAALAALAVVVTLGRRRRRPAAAH